MKHINIVVMLILSGIFFDFRSSQFSFRKFKTVTGEDAEKLLIKDENARTSEIQSLQNKINRKNEKLSVKEGLKAMKSPVSKFLWAVPATKNLGQKRIYEFKLNRAEKKLKKEQEKEKQLIKEAPPNKSICKKAFKNPYFVDKWELIENHETNANEIVRVLVEVEGKEKQSFWRNTKVCVVKNRNAEENQNSEPFNLYLSPTYDFSWSKFPIFVFVKKRSKVLQNLRTIVVKVDSFSYRKRFVIM